MNQKYFSLLLFALLFFYDVSADVGLPKIFSENMVLQRNKPVPVWGWANPGENITVLFGKQRKKTVGGKNGKWMIELDAMEAGGPYQLTVKGSNSLVFNNVLVGEVWICSGQSNMEMPIAGWGKVNHYEQEIAAADYPQIRQFHVAKTMAAFPKNDVEGDKWTICNPGTAGDFTATGYFFARELYNHLHVPIGIINASWGGTMVETWISRDAFEKTNEFKEMIAGIPAERIDLQIKQKGEALQKKLSQGYYTNNADASHWKDEYFDDSRWPKMKLPGIWEQQKMGLEDLDGLVWFRKTITITDSDAGKPAIVRIGQVDDSGEIFVNGIKVGETKNEYGENRFYKICPGVLKAGMNTISIRIEDTGGYGGIVGNDRDMHLAIENKSLPLSGDWFFQVESVYLNKNPNSFPTLLYNTMINPLIPYAIKGVVWYQGESNAGRAFQYRKAFPLMINDWRERWGEGNFPFYFVQLASFDAGGGNSEKGSAWAELREAQTMTLALPNTGMAVTVDIGNAHDIHPKNKQEVGKRLAAIALANDYAQMNEFSGPVFSSAKTDGNRIILSFSHDAGELEAKDKYGYLKGFEVAGNDRKFHYAKACISKNSVIVYSDEVPAPVSVRYAWTDDAADANLFNKEGFPASPFRTDSWPGITDNTKYTVTQ